MARCSEIGELTAIGEVSIPGSHGARVSLIWITNEVSDVSCPMVRRFRLDKQEENLSLINFDF